MTIDASLDKRLHKILRTHDRMRRKVWCTVWAAMV
jgi:hypothetical protein